MCNKMTETVERLLQEFRSRIKIGKIVSVYDAQHPEYFKELFMVIGFQQDINDKELIVALMDREYKTFLTHIDNIIIKALLTIDDMFPPELVKFYQKLTSEITYEV